MDDLDDGLHAFRQLLQSKTKPGMCENNRERVNYADYLPAEDCFCTIHRAPVNKRGARSLATRLPHLPSRVTVFIRIGCFDEGEFGLMLRKSAKIRIRDSCRGNEYDAVDSNAFRYVGCVRFGCAPLSRPARGRADGVYRAQDRRWAAYIHEHSQVVLLGRSADLYPASPGIQGTRHDQKTRHLVSQSSVNAATRA